MISYQRISPPNHLKEWVQFFWIFEGCFSEVNKYQQLTSASVFPKLAFQYEKGMSFKNDQKSGTELFRSGFQGQTDQYDKIAGFGNVGVIGVHFYPQSLPTLFGLSAIEMVNTKLEISEVLGYEGKTLEDKIMTASNNEQRISILCDFLETKVVKLSCNKQLLTSSIQTILEKRGEVRIDELVSSYSISQRQFERIFKDLTGFSAKKFSRIVRFESCLVQAFQVATSFTKLSYDLGYADQSHFIKEFKQFTGLNPKRYFSEDLSIFRKS